MLANMVAVEYVIRSEIHVVMNDGFVAVGAAEVRHTIHLHIPSLVSEKSQTLILTCLTTVVLYYVALVIC